MIAMPRIYAFGKVDDKEEAKAIAEKLAEMGFDVKCY